MHHRDCGRHAVLPATRVAGVVRPRILDRSGNCRHRRNPNLDIVAQQVNLIRKVEA
jgi:hypothetical protein